MSDSQPTPAAAVAPSRALRILRGITVVILALALSLLIVLALAATLPVVAAGFFKPLVSEHPAVSVAAGLAAALAVLLVPLYILGTLVRRGAIGWAHLGVVAVAVGGCFLYLAWDEPTVRRPLTMDELAPALPGDEASYAVIMRYARNTPATNAYRSPKFTPGFASAREPEKYIAMLREHRAEIEAQWTELAAVRAWWDELAALPRLADLGATRADAPILAFQPVRSYSQHAAAIAALQALDGHGDEAAATIMRLYDVARKLEPTSRTLVRTMIAKVMQRIAIENAVFIIEHAQLSPATRDAMRTMFAPSPAGGAAGARRLMLIEYAYFQPAVMEGGAWWGDARGFSLFTKTVGRVLINPRATQNLVGDRYYALAALAEQRQLGQLESSKSEINREFLGGYHMKNLGGRLLADLAMPALSKVVKSYWEIEDARVALVQRLKA